MKTIQKKVGANPDGIFGPKTATAIKDFYGLSEFEAAHLLGQAAHESNGFTVMEENMNYSAKRLLEVFPKYFDNMLVAQAYAYKPELIANRVYANRMGNGPEGSGDGWKHRGQGPLQLTGKEMHKDFSIYVKDPEIFCNPELIGERYPMESAIYYFEKRGIFRYCKDVTDKTILAVSRVVNIGNANTLLVPHGMPSRRDWTKKIYNWLV